MQLLLPAARSEVLVKPHTASKLRIALIIVGSIAVLVGAWDTASRISKLNIHINSDFAMRAFAPAIVALDPAARTAAIATTTPPAIVRQTLVPVRIKIPVIGVNARIEQVGVKPDGSMENPARLQNVGWYSLGSKPGQDGNTVFAGHVNNGSTSAGVFEHLNKLKIGDYITVEDADGKALIYVVSDAREYPYLDAPTGEIFTTQGKPQLALITCIGSWDKKAKTFDKRLVVLAQPLQ